MTSFHSLKKRDNRIEEDQIQWNARTYLLGIVLLKRCILPRLTLKVTALAPASRQSCVETDAGRQASLSHFPALGRRARFMFSPSSDWCILSARVVIGHAEKHAFFQPIGGKEGVFYQDLHRRLPWVLETFHVQFPVLVSLQWPPWPKVKGIYNSRLVLSDENGGYFMPQLIKQLI